MSATQKPPSTPRWVKIFVIVFILLVLLVVILHLMGFGFGSHHIASATAMLLLTQNMQPLP